ncbi:hypothetical protein [Yoonia sp. SS1-5]|uniref:Uncharacterized protein n=1 Tax=Yoonia rhodophyticola TaxID=3137370 RepID=A0AAN0M7U7_9RHOB
MSQLRTTLTILLLAMVLVTLTAVTNEGFDLISPYVGPILALSWQGQFNVDFACYLVLSGIWMAWRQGFTNGGISLGVLAPPLGMLFFAPYLIYLIGKSGGDPRRFLLGVHAETGDATQR